MNIRSLLIFTLFLLGIYGLSQFYFQKSTTSFNTHLIQIDTVQVTTITILPKAASDEIHLQRTTKGWQVTSADITTQALEEQVHQILEQIKSIKTIRVASNKVEEWEKFGLEEEATRVKVFTEQLLLEEFLVGHKKAKKGKLPDTTFIRLAGEHEVYAVSQFSSQFFNQTFNSFRQGKVIQIADNQSVNNIVYVGDYTDTLSLINDSWASEKGIKVDSVEMINYLRKLKNIKAEFFADNFNEVQMNGLPVEKLIFRGDNIESLIQITAYQDSTAILPYIIHSTQFSNAFYASDSTGIYQQIFSPVIRSKSNKPIDEVIRLNK